jgi:hypothetical protein
MSNRQFNQSEDFGAYIKRHLRSLKELILNCIIPRERCEAIQEENDRREDFRTTEIEENHIKKKLKRGQEILKTNERRFSRTFGISRTLDSF